VGHEDAASEWGFREQVGQCGDMVQVETRMVLSAGLGGEQTLDIAARERSFEPKRRRHALEWREATKVKGQKWRLNRIVFPVFSNNAS